MKTKNMFVAFGATLAAGVLIPVTASAHSYDGYQPGNDYGHSASYNQNDDEQSEAQRCEKLGYRLDSLYQNFDQTNDRQVSRTQTVIDKLNDQDCPAYGSVVDTLVKNGNFKTLVAAVQAAGLTDALNSASAKTVFAPTDQAFAALPAGTVQALLADVPTLTKILTYHVVDGAVDSAMAIDLGQATTLNGQDISIGYGDDGVYVNDSKLVLTDIKTSNGIIHPIDTVLMPQL